MSLKNISDISLSKLRGYRDFVFQPDISKPTHQPFFSLECCDTWATLAGYELYETWLKNAKDLALDGDRAQTIVDMATIRDIKQFKDIIITPTYTGENYFSTDNFHNWIRPVAFEAWMLWYKQEVREPEEESRPSSRLSLYSRDSLHFSETDFVDDPCPPSTRPSSSMSGTMEEAPSDDPCHSYSPLSPTPFYASVSEQEPPQTQKTVINGPLKITSKLKVDTLNIITSLPSTWVVPRDQSATLVDLSALESLPSKPNGGRYSIDTYIRAEDQDSWGGSAGHSAGDTLVLGFNQHDLTEKILCRRAFLHCNGIDVCEHFNQDILKDCERYEPDPKKMEELWKFELDANEKEAQNEVNIISRFYTQISELKCKIKCSGKAIMQKRRSGCSKFGKYYFIGCSAWKYTERDDHCYLPIPSNINEDILSAVIENGGMLPSVMSSTTSNANCTLVVHPRSALNSCPYSHVIDGKISTTQMVNRECPTRMAIFIPVDKSIQKAIVYLRNPHNHPMFPKTKPSTEEKNKLKKAINAAGKPGLTLHLPLKFMAGVALPLASPAYMDRRKIRNAIQKEKMEDYPMGTGWEGLLHQHMDRESKLPVTERYIHAVTVTPEAKWVITMHPQLAKYIHSVLYICIDYTFKRVKGDIDEWEVVGFLDRFQRRVTLACFYCDRNTRNAFSRLFSELFRVVPELTGEILKFYAFFPEDPNALLRAIILDAEAPQVQGLGDELLVYVAKYVPETTTSVPRNSLELLKMVLKTCSIHFERNIDKLPKPLVLQDTINRLKEIMGLKTHDEILEWHEFCKSYPDKCVRDWYQQKINNPWFLPSINSFLSKMDSTSWNLTPNHSNLVEGAHSGTNEVTSIGKQICEAVMSARELDNKVADELAGMERNGTLPKRWSGPLQRERFNSQRRAWTFSKKADRDEKLACNDEFTAELNQISSQLTDSLSLEKSLQAQIRELRDSHDSNRKARIKEIQGKIEDEKNKRRQFNIRKQEIKKSIQELKDTGLSGSRVNGRRPQTSQSVNSIAEQNDNGTQSMVVSNPEIQFELDELEESEHDEYLNINEAETFKSLEPLETVFLNEDLSLNTTDTYLENEASLAVESFSDMLADPNIGEYYNHSTAESSSFPNLANANFEATNFDFNFEDIDFDNLDLNLALSYSSKPADVLLPPYSPPNRTTSGIIADEQVPISEPTRSLSLLGPTVTLPPLKESHPASSSTRAAKRKKSEINEADILPEGSRRIRNKSAKALASDNL